MKKLLIYLTISLIMVSCGKNNSNYISHIDALTSNQADESNSSIEISNSSSNITWDHSYTLTLSEVLSDPVFLPMLRTNIDPEDLKELDCINFNIKSTEQRKQFYIVLIAAIAEAESDFDTNNETYNRFDSTNNIGLLQIDKASSYRHAPHIGLVSNSDLKKAEINLEAGAYILKNQVMGGIGGNRPDLRGRLFTNTSYYWAVLKHNIRVKKNFKINMEKSNFCTKA